MSFKSIGDYVELQRGTTYKSALLDQEGPYLLGLGSIARDGGFRSEKLRTYGGPSADKLLVYPGDMYVSLKDVTQSGDLLGSVARVPDTVKVGRMTQDTVKLCFKSDISKEYFYWILRSPQYRQHCRSHATGTTNLGLSRDDFFSFAVPELTISREKITNVLEDIESKINLNSQTNQTLEQVAQAIFKSWFVDFDPVKAKMKGDQPEGMDVATASLFPEKLVESELGLIPEGWEVKPFKKVIDKYVDNRGKTPPIVEEGIPLVEVKHLPESSAFPNLSTDKRVTEETFNTWFRVHVEPKDVLISTVGTIGRTSFVKNTNFGIAQNVLGLRFGKIVEPEYMFYTIKAHRFQHDMDARLVTTVQSSIKRKDLDTIDILVPPSNVQKEFCKLVGSLLDGQYSKNAENINLASLRDILLPKLLSGEIDLETTIEN
ncbi:restriction endonuclease subunit S [Vibrio breoganii]